MECLDVCLGVRFYLGLVINEKIEKVKEFEYLGCEMINTLNEVTLLNT